MNAAVFFILISTILVTFVIPPLFNAVTLGKVITREKRYR